MIGIGRNLKQQPNVVVSRSGASLEYLFAQNASVAPRVGTAQIATARTGSATRFNSSGVLETVSANMPRIDYDPATLLCKGLLIEETRKNFVRNNEMTGAVVGTPGALPDNWSRSINSGITSEVTFVGQVNGISVTGIRVSGTPTATSFNSITWEGSNAAAAAAGQTWASSASVALVAGSLSNVTSMALGYLEVSSTGAGLISGLLGTVTGLTSDLKSYAATRTLQDPATAALRANLRWGYGNTTSPVDFTILIGMPRLEQGAFASSILPGNTTRGVESVAANSVSSVYNQVEGTFVIDATMLEPVGSTCCLAQFDAGTSDRILTWVSAGVPRCSSIVGGVTQANITPGALPGSGRMRIAFRYKQDDFAASMNGGAVVKDSLGTVPTGITALRFGSQSSSSSDAMIAHEFRYWPYAMTDAELLYWSTPI
jgi:hypothetical protein